MAATKSKVEYLKRYGYKPEDPSSTKKTTRVKKRSHAGKAIPKSKIVDDDIDINAVAPNENDDNELETGEDAPQIAGIVDERPADLQKMELFAGKKWRVLGTDENGEAEVISPGSLGHIRRRHDSNTDGALVNQRVRRDSDSDHASAPGKVRHDSDVSPPRQRLRHDSDASPPRKTIQRDSDASPPRQRTCHDSDVSPPRRKGHQDSDASPPRQKVRRSYSSSPRRKTQRSRSSPSRHRGRQNSNALLPRQKARRDSDTSPPRRKNQHDSDTSPPRRKAQRHSSSSPSDNSSTSPPRQRLQRDSNTFSSRRKLQNDSGTSPPRKPWHDSASASRSRARHDSGTSISRRRNEQASDLSRRRHKITGDSDSSSPRQNVRHKLDNSPERPKTKHDSSTFPSRQRARHVANKSPPGRKARRDYDASPPRQNVQHNYSVSPPRHDNTSAERSSVRSNEHAVQYKRMHAKVASDYFPFRRKDSANDSDASPPRKGPLSQTKRLSKENSESDSDHSLPRKKSASSTIKPCKQASLSLREKSRNRSVSEEHVIPNSKEVLRKNEDYGSHSKRSSNKDGHRKVRQDRESDSDPSPPRKSRESLSLQRKTLDGKKAGLQDSKTLKLENEAAKERERRLFETMDEEVSGKNAKTVLRDRSTGLRRDLEEEKRKQVEEDAVKAEQEAKYHQWGKGVKQTEMQRSRFEQDLKEISKPLARYEDDEDLDKILRDQDREGDPMLAFIKKKKITKSGGKEMPKYNGPQPPPNRFGIMPGYRWDGVDRSCGFEKARFSRLSNKVAAEEEAYKWSVEDM